MWLAVKKCLSHMMETEFGSLVRNLARVLLWRKQEDSFLSAHTLFPGEEVRALKKKLFFVDSVTERHLFSDDHICLYNQDISPERKKKS